MRLIYKLLTQIEWDAAKTEGVYRGSAHDARDGFIHFSTATQLAETAAKHFRGVENLVLLEVNATPLGAALRWEPSRGGASFPHLYGPLNVSCVGRIWPLTLNDEGAPRIPTEVIA